jgi:hypothetical protein
MNYGNRNATTTYTTGDLMFGYSAAVISSVGLGLGLQRLCKPFTRTFHGGSLVLANSIIAYIAVGSAGFLNSYCMRMGEMEKGIKIFDEDEVERGISKKAAKTAVINTASSRPILSIPTFFIPGILMFLIDKVGLMPKGRVARTTLDLAVISFALFHALPLSVSIFPSKGEISADILEPEFKQLINNKG